MCAAHDGGSERMFTALLEARRHTLGRRLARKGRDLFQPVRAALTGRTHGPELPLLAELLGRARCIERLRAAARGQAVTEDATP